jgi:hypothetical protein
MLKVLPEHPVEYLVLDVDETHLLRMTPLKSRYRQVAWCR